MRQRAADDVETIYEGIQRLKRERAQSLGDAGSTHVEPPCDTEQPRLEDYACGLVPVVYQWTAMGIRYDTETGAMTWFEEKSPAIPGEQTDGA
jgi:hypothetical protein